MAMGKSRKRAPYLREDKVFKSDVTLYRKGVQFVIPEQYTLKDGTIKKHIATLIRNATKENILKLEEMGITCIREDAPEVGEKRFA